MFLMLFGSVVAVLAVVVATGVVAFAFLPHVAVAAVVCGCFGCRCGRRRMVVAAVYFIVYRNLAEILSSISEKLHLSRKIEKVLSR